MNKLLYTLIMLSVPVSCGTKKDSKQETNAQILPVDSITTTVENQTIGDISTFINVDILLDESFVADSLIHEEAFNDDLSRYNILVEKYNNPYLEWKIGDGIDYKFSEKLVLRLEKTESSHWRGKEQFKIILYSILNNEVVDSLAYHKFETTVECDTEDCLSFHRNETFSYYSNLSIRQLETLAMKEDSSSDYFESVRCDKWVKYVIDPSSGRLSISHHYYNLDDKKYDYSIFKEYNPNIVGKYEIDYQGTYITFNFEEDSDYTNNRVEVVDNGSNPYIRTGKYTVEKYEKYDTEKGLDSKWILKSINNVNDRTIILRKYSSHYWLELTAGGQLRIDTK